MSPDERAQLQWLGNCILAMAETKTAICDVQPPDLLLAAAQRERRRRDGRLKLIAHQLKGEANWDMLLDLFIADRMGEPVETPVSKVPGEGFGEPGCLLSRI